MHIILSLSHVVTPNNNQARARDLPSPVPPDDYIIPLFDNICIIPHTRAQTHAHIHSLSFIIIYILLGFIVVVRHSTAGLRRRVHTVYESRCALLLDIVAPVPRPSEYIRRNCTGKRSVCVCVYLWGAEN